MTHDQLVRELQVALEFENKKRRTLRRNICTKTTTSSLKTQTTGSTVSYCDCAAATAVGTESSLEYHATVVTRNM